MKYFFFLLLVSCSTTQKASKVSKVICNDLNLGADFTYSENYSKEFQSALPKEQLAEIYSQVKSQYGDCVEVVDFKASINGDKFSTKHENGQIIDLTIVEKNSKITGLWILGERSKPINYADFKEAKDDINSLARPSLLILKNENPILSINENKRTPLGSTFKLFVLDGLLQQIKDKKLTWEDELKVSNNLKSLPSGEMQNKEDGEYASLYEYAQKMISISDNTATDHLIEKIGRTSVERQIKSRGLKLSYGWNRPFLTTKELFQVRSSFNATDYKKYANNTTTGRILQLQKVSKVKTDELMNKLSGWQTPRGVLDTEWFSNPKEICRLLTYFDQENSEEIDSILSRNTPFADKDLFDKIYYKGGSEPGVLQMAYYFKKGQDRYCLFIGTHDLQNSIDETSFFEKVKATIRLIQADLPKDDT